MAKRDDKGRFVIGEPQDTNKNGTAGRPSKMTPERVKQLKVAFSYWMTDKEACEFAGISKKTLYNYIDDNPEFSHLKKQLKTRPSVKAKMNLIDKIQEGNYNASLEWLKRKNSDEFSTKKSVEHGGGMQIENKIDEDVKKIADEVIETDDEKEGEKDDE